MDLEIGVDDPVAEDVRALLAIHLASSRSATPVEYSFALDAEQLMDPGVTFFSARDGGRLVAVAALKRLNDGHAELKSMHTREADRGLGVGRALVEHILAFAAEEAYRRVSLETGTTAEFVAARILYSKCGFKPCGAFGGYSKSPYNAFMTISLDPEEVPPAPRGHTAVVADSSPT